MLTLTGSNTYSGPTTINGGLIFAGSHNTLSPNSAITVNGGVLDVTSAAQKISSLTIGAQGSLSLHRIHSRLVFSNHTSLPVATTIRIAAETGRRRIPTRWHPYC